jgi:hypothetical protein
MTQEHDPVKEQDDRNEDDEFKRVAEEQKLREKKARFSLNWP